MAATTRRHLTLAAIGAALLAGAGAFTLKPRDDAVAAVDLAEYTCPMHPYVKQSAEGTCPSCGMNLVKKSENELRISARRRQLIGVRFATVENKEMTKTLIAAGTIAPDESKIVDVLAETTGTVEQVLGNPVGQQVRRGEPLFSVLGPDAKKSLIRANATGHIYWRVTFAGAQVTPKLKVCTIYDHSTVWAWVEVYETDIALVKLGQSATMSVPAFPGRLFTGKITQISPVLQADTHTMKVRLDFANSEYLLKPGMSAIVELAAPLGTKLAIPEASVIRTGTENVVFVSKGEGKLEVKNVELGVQAAGWYEVVSGVEEGDKLVAAANFLIDAESKLQGIRSSWNR